MILVLIAFVISPTITIGGFVSSTSALLQDTVWWREKEYAKIRLLRAGISREKIQEILGPPIFVRKYDDEGLLTEASFRRRDYWVQAVYDSLGTAKLLSVTACDTDFRPKIEAPDGSELVLNESTFAAALRPLPDRVRYLIQATAPPDFIEEFRHGNPGMYKTHYIGIKGACPSLPYHTEWSDGFLMAAVGAHSGEAPSAFPGNDLYAFRAGSVINMYAEVDVYAGLTIDSPPLEEMFPRIGVDYLLTRTVDLEDPRRWDRRKDVTPVPEPPIGPFLRPPIPAARTT